MNEKRTGACNDIIQVPKIGRSASALAYELFVTGVQSRSIGACYGFIPPSTTMLLLLHLASNWWVLRHDVNSLVDAEQGVRNQLHIG